MVKSGQEEGGARSGEGGLLDGIRVVEFGQFVAAPHTTLLLASLGAEVIKVERPVGGEEGRAIGVKTEAGVSGFFAQQNWGKKSFSADLKHPEGKEAIRKLCQNTDIVVENYRPGTLDRLGLGYGDLSEENPGLIMCSITAFGQTGPYRKRPGFGPLVEALAGIPELTGEPNGPPVQTRYMIADNIAADKAVGAICASLFDRTRSGRGQYIDIALLDCVIEGDENVIQHFLWTDGAVHISRRGQTDDTVVPFGIFPVAGRFVALHCATSRNWQLLCEAIGRPEWATDTRFATLDGRRLNRTEVYDAIRSWLVVQDDARSAVGALQAGGVPCEIVQGVEEVIRDPQVRARDMLVERDVPGVGRRPVVNVAYKITPKRAALGGTPPFLGEHTTALLEELGYGDGAVRHLFDIGAVYKDPSLDQGTGPTSSSPAGG